MHLTYMFTLGWVLYMSAAVVAYHPQIKSHMALYYTLGLMIALGCNFTWLFIAKHTENSAQLYFRGLVWGFTYRWLLCVGSGLVLWGSTFTSIRFWAGTDSNWFVPDKIVALFLNSA